MLESVILQIMLALAPPGASHYSVVPAAECGTSRAAPTCSLDVAAYPPRWSFSHRAWVRLETAAEATARYGTIARAIVDVAKQAVRVGHDGAEPLWPWPAQDLAMGLATIAYHESGFRRDVHSGVGPAAVGDCSVWRDAGGQKRRWCRSVCLAQINIGGLDGRSKKWGVTGRELVGLDAASTRRCFVVAARILSAARARCSRWVPADRWFRPAIVGYGSGRACSSGAKWVAARDATYTRFMLATSAAPEG